MTIIPPCKLFSQLQNLSMKKKYRNKELMQKYIEDKKKIMELLDFAISVCLLCQKFDIQFVLEYPFIAISWQNPRHAEFFGNPFFYFFRIDQCEYGLQGSRGGLHRKSTGFVTNCKVISMILRRRYSGEYEHEIIIGGKISELAQKYPKTIIDQILGAYQENIYKIVELMSWRRING